MPELIYVSTAKLRRFATRPRGSVAFNGRADVGIAELSIESGRSATAGTYETWRQVEKVCRTINSSKAFHRVATEHMVPGSWFQFRTRMRWGKIGIGVRNGSSETADNMVMFGGPSPSENPRVVLLLGGWAGHLVDDESASDKTGGRIGSGIDAFLRIWNDQVQNELSDRSDIRPEILQIGRGEPGRDRMADVFWNAYYTFDHALAYYPSFPLEGFAQVLQVIQGESGQLPMVIGSPLFVSMASDPV